MRVRAAFSTLRARLPSSSIGWARLVAFVFAVGIVAREVAYVVAPLVWHLHGYGRHVWDQTEANRYFVVKSLLRFHELPFWNPYACGGFPAWGGFENDTNLVSPFLPVYLALDLPVAIRVEILVWIVVSAAGAWALASRFTRSPAMCAFVAVLFAVSGRLTLQLAAGHMWNLLYALMPWSIFLFDRAATSVVLRWRDPVALGFCFAVMVYAGGIYPLPQTLVVLGVYAVLLAVALRTVRPVGVLAAAGAISVGLSAPKLLPLLDVMHRYPRVLDSPESMTFEQIAAVLLDRDQGFKSSHAGIPWPSWHEHGMYVGLVALVVLGVGAALAPGIRARSLRLIGMLFGAFAFGSFSPYAPWALAHRLPLLSSQHVPSRWLYPAALLLACAAVAVFEHVLARAGRARAVLEIALLPLVGWVAWDVAHVARQPLEKPVLQEPGPQVAEREDGFVTEVKLPASLEYQPGEWAPTSLAPERANLGTIECNMFHGLNNFDGAGVALPGYEGRPSELGAHGRGDTGYHGEAYLEEGRGTAVITAWTPNAVEVRVEAARAGDHVVLNQNWDSGWRVDGADALNLGNTIAGTLRAPSATVRFVYRPPLLWPGLFLFATTCGALIYGARGRRSAARPRAMPRS